MATPLDTSLPYGIDDEERFVTRCFHCFWRIPYEKYAERKQDYRYWFCSPNCIQAAVVKKGPEYCWPTEQENTKTLKEFIRKIKLDFNNKISRKVEKTFKKIEKSGLTRAEVKQMAEDRGRERRGWGEDRGKERKGVLA